MIYMLLRELEYSWRETDQILNTIGSMKCETAHKWSDLYLNGDFEELIGENRSGQRTQSFFYVYPKLELEARTFVVEECSKKASSFTVESLAKFLDDRFYEINGLQKTTQQLVRSIEMCRIDISRWRGRNEVNKNRPYFEGHGRPDVQQHRKEFIDHVLSNKNEYYLLNDEEVPKWIQSTASKSRILICKLENLLFLLQILLSFLFLLFFFSIFSGHDESTFRSGEVSG